MSTGKPMFGTDQHGDDDPVTCPHPEIIPNMSGDVSSQAIQLFIFGLRCRGCGKVWSFGEMLEAVRVLDEVYRDSGGPDD